MNDTARPFVPEDFEVPSGLITEDFHLVPLGPEHNLADYEAWTSSLEHIRATPGFQGRKWPVPMTTEQNLGDLERHAHDFAQRSGFTYTVLDPADQAVIGCLYIYPAGSEGAADVRSWVRASRAELDVALYREVSDWLGASWPFSSVMYAPR